MKSNARSKIRGKEIKQQYPVTSIIQKALIVRDKLIELTGNREQVTALLLTAKGYALEEVLLLTSYTEVSVLKQAQLTGKKKIVNYFLKNPKEAIRFKALMGDC